jgi:hypothetical protein
MTEQGILIDQPEQWLQPIIIALNDEHPIRRSEMRRLITAWAESGPDVRKLLERNTELKPYLYDKRGWPTWKAIPWLEGSGIRVMIMPEGPEDPGDSTEDLIRDEARLMFMRFLINPLRDKILGPCAYRSCKKYFLRQGARRPIYCSRDCQRNEGAIRLKLERYNEERSEKLKRVNATIKQWARSPTKCDWKTFVVKSWIDITPRFLAQAITRGDLVAPKKGK